MVKDNEFSETNTNNDKKTIIAPVGGMIDYIYRDLKDLNGERVILITPEKFEEVALETKKKLEKEFKLNVVIKKIKGNIWEQMFKHISELRTLEPDTEFIINVATGDRNTQCAATSAAFVNGIKAFSVDDNGSMLLPVMKFSYYKMLTNKKMDILKELSKENCCSSLEELSKKTKMSLPLISYHINGNLKSEGLKDLGLVETNENKGRIDVKLTLMGKMLLKGYL